MPAEKLSISMETSLLAQIRKAAAAEGVTVSMWLAEAAAAKARQRALHEALDAFAQEHGRVAPEEAARLVEGARRRSIAVQPKKRKRA